MQSKEEAFEKLSRSQFRMRFHLGEKELKYIDEKSLDTIRTHAGSFVSQKLAPAHPKNDGKQTPMRGHPVRQPVFAAGAQKSWLSTKGARSAGIALNHWDNAIKSLPKGTDH